MASSKFGGPDVGGDNDHTPRSTCVLQWPKDLRPCATLPESCDVPKTALIDAARLAFGPFDADRALTVALAGTLNLEWPVGHVGRPRSRLCTGAALNTGLRDSARTLAAELHSMAYSTR